MVILFLALLLFFAYRSFSYFSNGRAIAGVLASMACLLFASGIYVDYAKRTQHPVATAQAAD